jgi:hypothetical protein
MGFGRHILSRLFISHSSKGNVAAVAFTQWLGAIGWPNGGVFLDLDSASSRRRPTRPRGCGKFSPLPMNWCLRRRSLSLGA